MNRYDNASDFPYRDVLKKGRPEHTATDAFRSKHPSMPCSRRAKIFAPFDPLEGFHAALKQAEQDHLDKI